jgi:hypothetical protein
MIENNLLPKIYVSLPITGLENMQMITESVAKDYALKHKLWAYTPSKLAEYVDRTIIFPEYKHYIAFDLWSLSRCESMLLMPNWENSSGCKEEINFCLKYGIPIIDFITQKSIDPKKIDRVLNPDNYISRYHKFINAFKNLFLCLR